jgi:hypothetical protein
MTTTPVKPITAASETDFLRVYKNKINALLDLLLGDRILSDPALAIGSTDENVASAAFTFQIAGVQYSKAAVAAGTALAAGTIPADKWGLYKFVIGVNGTIDCLAAAANFTTGYDTEAEAIAAIPATTAAHAPLGYITVLTAVGDPFVGGTDALQGGTGGNPASDTNYYDATPTEVTGAAGDVVDTDNFYLIELI